MAKKVPFYHLWDVKSVIYLIIVSAFFGGLFFFNPIRDLLRDKKGEGYNGVTQAFIINIQKNEHMSQSYRGNRVKPSAFKIQYEYYVDSIAYEKTELISPARWLIHLEMNKTDSLSIPFLVNYDLSNHSKSLLILKSHEK